MLATVVTTMSIATERSAQLGAALRGAPALGLGMASLGRPGYINLGHGADLPEGRSVEDMRAHAHEVLDEAYALGVRYIDCARSYGLSEDFVGSWLADRGADATAGVVVGSKCTRARPRTAEPLGPRTHAPRRAAFPASPAWPGG